MRPIRNALLFLLLGLGAFAMPAPPVPIQADKVKDSEVRFLYPAGQVYDYDKVFPLVVELHNRSTTPRTYKASWSLEIDLPEALEAVKLEPGEKRRFPLVFPRNEISRGGNNIEFNKVSYTADLQPNPRQSITGLLSPNADKFDYLRTLKLEVDPNAPVDPSVPEKSQVKLVPLAALSILDPELVPESWSLLASLDVLIAYDLRSMSLSKAQMEALVCWACEGGNLVLVSDGLPEEFRGTPFEPHLPLKPTGVNSSQGLVQLVGEPAPGAEVLMSYNTRPLLLKKPLMRGNVFLITAPLKEQAPLTVDDAEALWRQVQPTAPDTSSPNYNYGYYSGGNSLTSNTLKDIPELPRASAGWVALFLLVYALIVGPVNLGILRRKDRMLWSFVTVPVIALLFAGGAYLMNLANRSAIPVLRELGVMQIKSGASRGNAESEGLLFSPSARRYLLDCSPQAICHASTYRYDEAPFGMYNILPDGGLQASVDMGTWDVFMLGTESLIDLPKPITGRWKNGTLTVDSPYATESAEAQVFNLEKGASQPFALKGGTQTEKLELTDPGGYNKFDALGHPADGKAHPGREALVTAVSQQSGMLFSAGKTYLLFWTDQVQASVKPQAPAVHRAEYLVVVELES